MPPVPIPRSLRPRFPRFTGAAHALARHSLLPADASVSADPARGAGRADVPRRSQGAAVRLRPARHCAGVFFYLAISYARRELHQPAHPAPVPGADDPVRRGPVLRRSLRDPERGGLAGTHPGDQRRRSDHSDPDVALPDREERSVSQGGLGRRDRVSRLLPARRAGPGRGHRHPGFLPTGHRRDRRAFPLAPVRAAAAVRTGFPSPKQRLAAPPPAVLNGLKRGMEKESLRVRPDGALALTPHPAALGSALKHPHITTDFSEALIELITGVHTKVEACREELKRIHQFVYRHIGDEVLWGASMPCSLPDENAIPIARYGNSNVGRAKTVYRIGLAHRYGKRMQMISGLHYNWSLPEAAWPLAGDRDANEAYFALVRNFRRHAWFLLYLFGASPAVCASFDAGRKHALEELAPGTLSLPHATSLRMEPLGYIYEAQNSLAVSD